MKCGRFRKLSEGDVTGTSALGNRIASVCVGPDLAVLVGPQKRLHLAMVPDPEDLYAGVSILEQEPEPKPHPAFKKVRAQFSNSQTGMRVRMTEGFEQLAERFPRGFPLRQWQGQQLLQQLGPDDERLVQSPSRVLRSSGVSTMSLPCFFSRA